MVEKTGAEELGLGQSNTFERLWLPHRAHYISHAGKENATFAELPQGTDEESLIVARGQYVYVVLNLYPYSPGHSMVVPYRQVANLEDLDSDEAFELITTTQKVIRVMKKVARPHAFNVGLNLGKSAGGSISEHLHQHIVPRWVGDSSFISVTGNVKIMPVLLHQTRELFADMWERIDKEDLKD